MSDMARLLRALAEQMERATQQKESEIREKWKLVEFPAEPTQDRTDLLRAFMSMEPLTEQIILSGTSQPAVEILIAGAVIGVLLVQEAGLDWTNRMLLEPEENLENLQYSAAYIRAGYQAAVAAEKRAQAVYDASKKGGH